MKQPYIKRQWYKKRRCSTAYNACAVRLANRWCAEMKDDAHNYASCLVYKHTAGVPRFLGFRLGIAHNKA